MLGRETFGFGEDLTQTPILRVLASVNQTQSSPQRGFSRGGVRGDFGE